VYNFNKRYYNLSKQAEYDDLFYILFEDLVVNFDTSNSTVRFLFNKTDIKKVEAVIAGIKNTRSGKQNVNQK
jgi:hypothetical protein